MPHAIATDRLLTAISEACPAGSDLRYTPFYEEIMEARRYEDAIALGDWQHDVKRSDWDEVIALSVAALSTSTKDLQIAVWLTEALAVVDGFEGLDLGIRLITGLVERFWDSLYPLGEGGDLEYRAAPFEFLNEKVAMHAGRISITDGSVTPGYCWHKWQESRAVGYESETRNRYGDADEEKRSRRDRRIAEGALSAEEFDAAVVASAGSFSRALSESVNRCRESLQVLVRVVDQKFGPDAPTLADLGAAVEASHALVMRVYGQPDQPDQSDDTIAATAVQLLTQPAPAPPAAGPARPEVSLWGDAVAMLDAGRLQDALGMLLFTCNSSESARDRNRIRLLMGKLCLKAGRSDLARPIIEELHGKMEEHQLERWESPLWIAEVLDAYYQCLRSEESTSDDRNLAQALFRRICTLDVTKAIPHRI